MSSSSALVHREFIFSNKSLLCWIVRIVDDYGKETFWFKGSDISSFLGYQRSGKAVIDHVQPKYKKSWQELMDIIKEKPIESPINWQPTAIFVSEPGLYSLITRSKLPEAIKFTEWVHEDVLPSLRQEGLYKFENKGKDKKIEDLAFALLDSNKALITANTNLERANTNLERAYANLERARQDGVALFHRFLDIAQDVIAKPDSQQLLHALAVHELNPNSGEIAFTRCQRRSLNTALKRLTAKNPGARELYRNGYVPNGINVLNCVKDSLKRSDITYTAKCNVIIPENMISDEIVSFVRSAISSPKFA